MAQRIEPTSTRHPLTTGVSAIVALFIVATIVGIVVFPDVFTDLGYLALPMGHFVGGLLMIRHARRSNAPDSRAFAIIGSAALLAATGVVVFVVASFFVTVPSFSALDAFFLIAYVLFVLGLAYMPAVSHGWRSQVRIVLDGLVGAVALSALLWATVVQPIVEGLSVLPLDQRVIGTVYPVLDVAMIIGMMVVFLRRGSFQFDRRLLTLTIAFAFQAIADLEYLTKATSGSFNDADPDLLPFLGASLAILVTGILVRGTPPPIDTPDRATPIWALLMPYGAGVALIGFDVYAVATGLSSPFLDLATGSVLVLVIARQSLAIHENRTKVEAERRSLIASVSHELRTPLTSMIGFLTVLQEAGDELPAEERAELSEVVLEQANYMGRMVTDIILLARDTPEHMSLLESDTPIQSLLTSILDTVGHDASKIETQIATGLEVRVDIDRIKQLTTNLLQNALRYGADRCQLHLEAHGNALVIEVHDNGPGVPKKYQRTIWERFERGSNQLNSSVPGTGLGLAIVDMIARAHGGTAAYRDSEVLGGACFAVSLPGRVVAELAPSESVSPFRFASQQASVRSP